MTGLRAPALAGALTHVALSACQEAASPGGAQSAEMAPDAVRPFTVAVPDSVLDDLQERLARTRLPDPSPGGAWEQGTDRAYLEGLLAHWRDGFDWRAVEAQLNALDHFVTELDGVDVHFVHERSPSPDAIPLLLLHGWPGSFLEFVDLVGPLTDPGAYGADASVAFHVVIPSLPGFGFSEAPDERGYSPERMADVMAALMERLGYPQYGVQGGDWGGIIGRSLAGNHPEHVIGLHSNFILGGPPPGADANAGVTPEEQELRRERVEAFAEGSAYQEIQGTKPQSLGYGLNDSPAGLAAWIVEKFHGWTDHDGDLEQAVPRDKLLANVTLYWVTGSITSSTRIYYESRHTPAVRPVAYVQVPTAAAIFPKEIYFTPRAWAESRYNIVRWTVMPRGGHFAALEEPDLLLDDVRAFFSELPRAGAP
ncbi:MAG: epoxide hydrolase [Gemmatimonadota bacterium]